MDKIFITTQEHCGHSFSVFRDAKTKRYSWELDGFPIRSKGSYPDSDSAENDARHLIDFLREHPL